MEGTSPVIRKPQNSRIVWAPGRSLRDKFTHWFSNWVPYGSRVRCSTKGIVGMPKQLCFFVSDIEVPRKAAFQTKSETHHQPNSLLLTDEGTEAHRTLNPFSWNSHGSCDHWSVLHFQDSLTRLGQCCSHSLWEPQFPAQDRPATRCFLDT